jgi:hypothetical protein
MTKVIFFLLLFGVVETYAQSVSPFPLEGHYSATLNGDRIRLDLLHEGGSIYTGKMDDSYQSYVVHLELTGTKVTGQAIENSLGLTFEVTGTFQGSALPLNFSFEFNGEKNSMDVMFAKASSSEAPIETGSNNTSPDLVFPAGATHPADLVGTWMKEELYQSGYGDGYMGAGFSQKMTFFPDGHVAEGASSSYISGSYYSGQSFGDGDGVIPGLAWYTIGKVFYIQLTENGKTQHIPLGTYYVEGNNMMITASSGDKLLLSRSR